MKPQAWEFRLLFVVTGLLVVIGLAAVYGASSLVTTAGGDQVGATFALRQAMGAAVYRTHGLGYVHEACTQLWNRGGERQVARHRVAACAAAGGPLGGALLLVRD